MKVFRRHFLIVTKEEVQKQLKDYYKDLIKDNADDIIEHRDHIIPDIVLLRGIEGLNDKELVNVASMGWSEMTLDMFNTDTRNKANPAVGIIMFVADRSKGPYSGTSHILTEDSLFDGDFERNPLEIP